MGQGGDKIHAIHQILELKKQDPLVSTFRKSLTGILLRFVVFFYFSAFLFQCLKKVTFGYFKKKEIK